MKKLTIWILTVMIALSLVVAGCSGGGAKVQTQQTNVTLGQQLIDLEKAYKQGLLSEKEYKKARENLLKGK